MEEFSVEDIHRIRIWENDQTVFKIEPRGHEFRIIMFTNTDGNLQFVQVAFYRDTDKILKLIKKIGLRPTNKILSLVEGKNGRTRSGLEK
jgi:hypothetical protein